jgi:hypothetical protein
MLALGLACLVAGIGIGLCLDRVKMPRRTRCSWCDVPTAKAGLCSECLGHDRAEMEGWQ